ncbi:biotin--[acetyl-CoA-carboxylase] ligase, partial [Lactobacillus nasalidis]
MQVFRYDLLPSTQDLAKELLEHKQPPFAVCALEQTAGYGKQGRAFYSPKQGLYLSVCLAGPPLPAATLAIGTGVADYLRKKYALDIGLKWVNDLYFKEKKVGGILTEQLAGGLVVGLGLNLATESFPADLPQAGSLRPGGAFDPDLAGELAEVIRQSAEEPGDFLPRYRQLSILLGRPVSLKVQGRIVSGTCAGFDEQGRLL